MKLSSSALDEVYPSIVLDPARGQLFAVWLSYNSSYGCVEGAFIDLHTLKSLGRVDIACFRGRIDLGYVSFAIMYGSSIYVLYVDSVGNEREIRIAIVDPENRSIVHRLALPEPIERGEAPRAAPTPMGVAVLARQGDGALVLALLNGSRVLWSAVVDEDAEPQRYALTYVPGIGIVVVYASRGHGAAKVYSLDGTLLASTRISIPIPTLFPSVSLIDSTTLAYTSINGIALLKTYPRAVVYMGSIPLPSTVTGFSVLGLRTTVLCVQPCPLGNNTLQILSILTTSAEAPELTYIQQQPLPPLLRGVGLADPLSIALLFLVILLLLAVALRRTLL